MSLKCYYEWQLGAIQDDITPLTLRITEDSAKQLVNSLQLTVICMIGLLRKGNVFYVSPAHSEILINRWNIYLGERSKELWN